MSTLYPAPATEAGTICPCTVACDAVRAAGSTYAQGHDTRAASWLTEVLCLRPRVGSTLVADYGSIGAAHRSFLDAAWSAS